MCIHTRISYTNTHKHTHILPIPGSIHFTHSQVKITLFWGIKMTWRTCGASSAREDSLP